MRRWLKRLLILAILLVVVAATPIVWIETACMSGTPSIASDYRPILEPAHHRNEIDSYLTYPEWSIVHAYEDLAGVMRRGSESRRRRRVGSRWCLPKRSARHCRSFTLSLSRASGLFDCIVSARAGTQRQR